MPMMHQKAKYSSWKMTGIEFTTQATRKYFSSPEESGKTNLQERKTALQRFRNTLLSVFFVFLFVQIITDSSNYNDSQYANCPISLAFQAVNFCEGQQI